MTSSEHTPYVVPMADQVDSWVVRCDHCDLLVEYATREDAEKAAEEAS